MNDAVVDLAPAAGLAVRLDRRTGELQFGAGVTSDAPGARRLDDLRDVLRDRAARGPQVVYRLYRDVRRVVDESLLATARLRYDLTVTLPGRFGREYAKTAGHYHPPGTDGVSFPEVYEVVHGRAAFVLQRVDDVAADRPQIEQVWVQICASGERILIPPGCGHVTVNIGTEPLVVSDLISLRCGHLYGSFQALGGAAYHVLVENDAEDALRLEPNPSYSRAPRAAIARGSRWGPFLPGGQPVYNQFKAEPRDFRFLDRPGNSIDALLALWRPPQAPSATGTIGCESGLSK